MGLVSLANNVAIQAQVGTAMLFNDAKNTLSNIQPAASYTYWGGVANKLDLVKDAVTELLEVCQNYWPILLTIVGIIVAFLIIAGGRQGRLDAKNKLLWALASVAFIMFVPTIVSLLMGFFDADSTSTI